MPILNKIPVLRKSVEIGQTVFFAIIISSIVGLILALPVMLLWNFVFASILRINVLQAWTLNILSGILFGQRNSAK